MSSPDSQAQLEQLRAAHNQTATAVTLQHKQAALHDVERYVTNTVKTAEGLTQAGYARAAALSDRVRALQSGLDQARQAFNQLTNAASAHLKADLSQNEAAIAAALDGKTALVAPCLSALQAIADRVTLAEEQLDAVLKPVNDARYPLDQLLNVVKWSQSEWEEFSGNRGAYGGMLIAAEAEWKQTGRGGDDPDGVLYLTERALIFEQKEKKGKTLGMFGGKMVHEVEWAIPLTDISDVRAKNEGMFGGRDILFISVSSGDPAPEVKVEVKGSADNKIWAAYIGQARTGSDFFAAELTPVPTPDLGAWTGDLPAAVVIPPDMAGVGGALASMLAGPKSAAPAKPSAAESGKEAGGTDMKGAMSAAAQAMTGGKQKAEEDAETLSNAADAAKAFMMGKSYTGGDAKTDSADDDDVSPAKGGEKPVGMSGGDKKAVTGGEQKPAAPSGGKPSAGGGMTGLAQKMFKNDDDQDDAPKGGQKPVGENNKD